MAKRIIWTEQARTERREILEYWFFRTGNKKYSKKLALEFRETVKYISLHNYLGRQTELVDIRVAVCGIILFSITLLKARSQLSPFLTTEEIQEI